jgi:hypothetical protein
MVNIFMTVYGKSACGNWRSRTWRRRPTLPTSSANMPKCCSRVRRDSTSSWSRPAKILTPSTRACWDTKLSAVSAEEVLSRTRPRGAVVLHGIDHTLHDRYRSRPRRRERALGSNYERSRAGGGEMTKAHNSQSDASHQPERRIDFREVVARQSGVEVAAARCPGSRHGKIAWQAGAQRSRRHARGQRDRNHPPLHPALDVELRHRSRNVSAGLLHHEVQPARQRVCLAHRRPRQRHPYQPRKFLRALCAS